MVAILSPVIVVFFMVVQISWSEVWVQDGALTFPLDAVKKLKALLEEDAGSPLFRQRSQLPLVTVCENPELPKEFKLVCKRKDAPRVFKRLNLAVRDTDLCELCVNAACTGCF